MNNFLKFRKKLLFSLLFLWVTIIQLPAQTTYSDYKTYFKSLNISNTEKYNYIIVYPLHHHFPADRTWVDNFINEQQDWDKVLIITIIQEQKQLNALNKYALNRKNLVIDSTYTFQNQSFYNYLPVIYSLEKESLKEEAVLTWEYSYHWWTGLYRKYKQ